MSDHPLSNPIWNGLSGPHAHLGLSAGKVRRYRPRAVAILGLGAYRTAFGRPKATLGLQPERLEGAELWVLPHAGLTIALLTTKAHSERSGLDRSALLEALAR